MDQTITREVNQITEQTKQIIAELKEGKSINGTAKKFNRSRTRIKQIRATAVLRGELVL